jgi:hypothetical protein
MGDYLGPWLFGFVIGFAFAGFVGFVSSQILWHWGRVRAIGQPQAIRLTTTQTPWQVLANGCQSLLILLSFLIVVAMVLLLAIFFLDWESVIVFARSVAQPR